MDNYSSPSEAAPSYAESLGVAEGFRADNPDQFSGTPQENTQSGTPQNVDESGMVAEQDLKSLLHSRKKEKSNPAEKRIKQVIFEKRAEEEKNVFLMHQNAQLQAQMAEMQSRAQQNEENFNAQRSMTDKAIEGRFLDTEESIRVSLRHAKENGDIERDVALTDQLAEIKAQKNAHEIYRIQQAQLQQQQIQNEPYVPYEINQLPPTLHPPVNLEFQEWIQENPWYQQNPRLRQEADMISDELATRLAYNNATHIIGTTEFLESVSSAMKHRYGQSQPQQQQYEQPQQNYVGPVNQRPSQAQQYMSNNYVPNGVPLTSEELMVARHLPRKQNETEADSINRYRKAKAMGASAPASASPTGTPYRYVVPM